MAALQDSRYKKGGWCFYELLNRLIEFSKLHVLGEVVSIFLICLQVQNSFESNQSYTAIIRRERRDNGLFITLVLKVF